MSSNDRIRMNEKPLLYGSNNDVSIKDATVILEQYAHKLFREERPNIKIIEVGSGDGSVTEVLKTYLADHYDSLVGSDCSDKMVKFANENYQIPRTTFITLDIEKDLPEHLMANFDYVISFYTFHWVKQQRKGFENIRNLLTEGGECLMSFLAYSPVYTIFLALSETDKWRSYMSKVEDSLSPYYDVQEPDRVVTDTLKDVGFQSIDVRCKQMTCVYEPIQKFRNIIEAIEPFKIPQDKLEEFLDDFMEQARAMRMVNENHNSVSYCYNLIVVHCIK